MGFSVINGPHVLYNSPPSIGFGIGGFGFTGCCSAIGSGVGFGVPLGGPTVAEVSDQYVTSALITSRLNTRNIGRNIVWRLPQAGRGWPWPLPLLQASPGWQYRPQPSSSAGAAGNSVYGRNYCSEACTQTDRHRVRNTKPKKARVSIS